MFGATMSQQRMKFLLASITFDDPDERAQCWPGDRFAVARKLFESFNKNCFKFLYHSEFLLLAETLYSMWHQIAFRQYNPNKPRRYGLLVKSLNDARVPFTYKAAPYSGKPKDRNGPYYIGHTENYVKYLVEEFEKMHLCLVGIYRLIDCTRLSHWQIGYLSAESQQLVPSTQIESEYQLR